MHFQVSSSATTSLLQNYAVLPLYLRARVECWEVPSHELLLDAELGGEQVKTIKDFLAADLPWGRRNNGSNWFPFLHFICL